MTKQIFIHSINWIHNKTNTLNIYSIKTKYDQKREKICDKFGKQEKNYK